jgi:hypothetical protein
VSTPSPSDDQVAVLCQAVDTALHAMLRSVGGPGDDDAVMHALRTFIDTIIPGSGRVAARPHGALAVAMDTCGEYST